MFADPAISDKTSFCGRLGSVFMESSLPSEGKTALIARAKMASHNCFLFNQLPNDGA
jgi:hypothetical protein